MFVFAVMSVFDTLHERFCEVDILALFRFFLAFSYFTFGKQFQEPKDGIPKGSPLSPRDCRLLCPVLLGESVVQAGSVSLS